MKRVANSYSARNRSAQAVAIRARATTFGGRSSATTRAESWIPDIPNYVWLAMIALAFMALSIATYFRAQGAEQDAFKSHANVVSRVEDARANNKQLRLQTEQIKTNPAIAAQKAQQQMRVLRPNEIVIATP